MQTIIAKIFFGALVGLCLKINRVVRVTKKKKAKIISDELILTSYDDVMERGPIY